MHGIWIDYDDPDDKSKGYSVKKGNMDLEGKLPSIKKGRPSKKYPPTPSLDLNGVCSKGRPFV